MYAVIETGGKQYRVEVGTQLEVELLDVEAGQSITLDRVLLVVDGDTAAVGKPIVDGAAVQADVVGAIRGDKVIAFKYRPKARRRVKKGHRQELTVLRIADITFDGKSAAEDMAEKAPKQADDRKTIEEAAARQAAQDAALAASLKVAAPAEAEAPAEASAEEAPAPKKTRTKAAAAEAAAEAPDADAAPADEPAAETEAAADAPEAEAAAETETTEAAPKKRATRAKKDE